ncbi:MAG: hypothetical protein AB2651_20930 [Candidatus Thiodiazotropha sp.]
MKEYLLKQFNHFEFSDVNPGREINEALLIFCCWSISAFFFVVWANTYYPENAFYQSAIREGIGPNLWNAIGSFGFFAFGVAIIFSQYSLPSRIARQILINTYAIGCLSFGLLLGQWWTLLVNPELIWWRRGLFGVTSGLLLAVIFLYNLAIWYLYYLLKNDSEKKSTFLEKLESMHVMWRFFIGLFFLISITILFFTTS